MSPAQVTRLHQTSLERTNGATSQPHSTKTEAGAERQRAQKLQNSEWLYATLRSIGAAVIATDASGNVCLLNRLAEELTGYTEAEALGRNVQEIIHTDDGHGHPLLRSDATFEHRHSVIVRRTGGRVPVSENAMPIRGDDGKIAGAVFLLRNAGRQNEAEEQLRRTNHELHLFVRSISHDLREPLRMISLYSDMIRHKLANPDPDIQEYLHYVIGGAERMAALLSDLRAYAEITAPASRPASASDTELVLQMALANLAAATEQSGAVIVHDPLPSVQVEHAHLLQLFQNLISNAIKYRREEPPLVKIAAVNRGELWEFSVADNGAGIARQYWDRVFDFFQRFHTSGIAGTGMGLAICQRIVQRYGGHIWLDSTPGTGSVFYFTLPACACDQNCASRHASHANS